MDFKLMVDRKKHKQGWNMKYDTVSCLEATPNTINYDNVVKGYD